MNDMSNHPAGQQFSGGHEEAGATSFRFKLMAFDKIRMQTSAAYLVRDILPRTLMLT